MIRARALPDALPRLHAVETAELLKVHQQTPCSFTAGRLLYRKDK